MAYKLQNLINDSQKEDKFLVILGKGHCEYGFGVPERVNVTNKCIISIRNKSEYEVDEFDETESEEQFEEFLEKLPADYVYFY